VVLVVVMLKLVLVLMVVVAEELGVTEIHIVIQLHLPFKFH
jgi:hypothetical protein